MLGLVFMLAGCWLFCAGVVIGAACVAFGRSDWIIPRAPDLEADAAPPGPLGPLPKHVIRFPTAQRAGGLH